MHFTWQCFDLKMLLSWLHYVCVLSVSKIRQCFFLTNCVLHDVFFYLTVGLTLRHLWSDNVLDLILALTLQCPWPDIAINIMSFTWQCPWPSITMTLTCQFPWHHDALDLSLASITLCCLSCFVPLSVYSLCHYILQVPVDAQTFFSMLVQICSFVGYLHNKIKEHSIYCICQFSIVMYCWFEMKEHLAISHTNNIFVNQAFS